MPPRGAGPALMGTRGWFQRSGSSSFKFLLAESDSLERSDHNVLQGTFCFQLSTVFQFVFLRTPEKKIFEDIIFLFFGEHLRLCPCPRKGLFSKGLSLASDIFLCPWPQPLCPQPHLCPVSV